MAKRKRSMSSKYFTSKRIKTISQRKGGQIGGGGWVTPVIDTRNPRYGAIPDKNKVVVPIKRKAPTKKRTSRVLHGSGIHNDLTVQKLGGIKVFPYPKKRPSSIAFKHRNATGFVINGGLAVMGVNGTVQGRQAVDYLEEIGHRNWWTATTSSSRFDRSRLAQDLYQYAIDYSYNYTGIQGEVARVYSKNRLYIDYVHVKYGLLSMTTVPQIVDIYFCTPKHDITVNPLTQLQTAIALESDGQRTSTYSAANTDTVDDTGFGDEQEWGASPFAVKGFRRAWKCLKKVTVTLNPGDQKQLGVTFKYGAYINMDTFNNFRTLDHLKGLTVTPLVVARAGLIGLKHDGETEANEVAYGKAKVGITSEMQIMLRPVKEPRVNELSRVFRGLQEDTIEVKQEIDDNDNVVPVEQN